MASGSFFGIVAAMDAVQLSTFSDYQVTIHFQNGTTADLAVSCITKNPAMEEDYVPGALSTPGAKPVTNLILFVKGSGTTGAPGIQQLTVDSAGNPTNTMVAIGDTATIGGLPYDIHRVDVDREGGTSLYLRRRTN